MHLVKHRKLIHSEMLVLLLASLLWLIGDNLLEFVFPTYLEGIQKSYFTIGLLLAMPALGGMLLALPVGALTDKVSRKKLMIYGLLLCVIAGVFVFFLKANFLLAIAFLGWGFGYQIWQVSRDAKFAALTDKDKRSECYGFDVEVKNLGNALGALIGGIILAYFGFSGVFNIYAIILILTCLVLLLFVRETNHHSIPSAISKVIKWNTIFSELKDFKIFGPAGLVFFYFALLFTAWEGILWTLGPLFFGSDVLNMPSWLGGLLMAVFYLPGIFLSYFTGRLADRVGKEKILSLGLVVMGIFLFGFSMVNNVLWVFLFAILVTVGGVIALPALNGLIVDLAYKHKKGGLAGIWNLFTDTGYLIGPFVGGLVAELVGLRYTFFAIGAIFFLSGIFLFIIKNYLSKISGDGGIITQEN